MRWNQAVWLFTSALAVHLPHTDARRFSYCPDFEHLRRGAHLDRPVIAGSRLKDLMQGNQVEGARAYFHRALEADQVFEFEERAVGRAIASGVLLRLKHF